jgi:hypothetical protein
MQFGRGGGERAAPVDGVENLQGVERKSHIQIN